MIFFAEWGRLLFAQFCYFCVQPCLMLIWTFNVQCYKFLQLADSLALLQLNMTDPIWLTWNLLILQGFIIIKCKIRNSLFSCFLIVYLVVNLDKKTFFNKLIWFLRYGHLISMKTTIHFTENSKSVHLLLSLCIGQFQALQSPTSPPPPPGNSDAFDQNFCRGAGHLT